MNAIPRFASRTASAGSCLAGAWAGANEGQATQADNRSEANRDMYEYLEGIVGALIIDAGGFPGPFSWSSKKRGPRCWRGPVRRSAFLGEWLCSDRTML